MAEPRVVEGVFGHHRVPSVDGSRRVESAQARPRRRAGGTPAAASDRARADAGRHATSDANDPSAIHTMERPRLVGHHVRGAGRGGSTSGGPGRGPHDGWVGRTRDSKRGPATVPGRAGYAHTAGTVSPVRSAPDRGTAARTRTFGATRRWAPPPAAAAEACTWPPTRSWSPAEPYQVALSPHTVFGNFAALQAGRLQPPR